MHDAVVVGAGPAGSSCAYWLAEAGWDVAVVEKKSFPREKTCGDGLTPRAVRQLADMGLEGALVEGAHRFSGLRSCAWGRTLELEWPSHPGFPPYGYTITRHDLDALVAGHAERAGATLHQRSEAAAPLLSTSPSQAAPTSPAGHLALPALDGVVVRDAKTGSERELRGRYVVVADGSNSRIGRALGTSRTAGYPLGMALRGYYRSEHHDDPYIESHLDVMDVDQAVPGYGWIFPLGDGRVNVGVGLLSTGQRWKGVNTSRLMETFVARAPERWGLSAATSCGPPTGGKLPMSFALSPATGPNVLVAGDAGGAINPFNGEGIAYAYETGRLAAACVADALSGGGPTAISSYDTAIAERYGTYYRVGRAFVRLISNPEAMRWCVSVGMHSKIFMAELMRIMANLMRPGVPGGAEVGYDALVRIAAMLPEGARHRLDARL